jgi:hypothetical protein
MDEEAVSLRDLYPGHTDEIEQEINAKLSQTR